jgi:hypothetical protein
MGLKFPLILNEARKSVRAIPKEKKERRDG